MRIKNATIVYVDIDGDIRSNHVGIHVFADKGAKDEVREIVRGALRDLNTKRPTSIFLYPSYFDISNVIKVDELLDEFIRCGGSSFGNWEIRIFKSDE